MTTRSTPTSVASHDNTGRTTARIIPIHDTQYTLARGTVSTRGRGVGRFAIGGINCDRLRIDSSVGGCARRTKGIRRACPPIDVRRLGSRRAAQGRAPMAQSPIDAYRGEGRKCIMTRRLFVATVSLFLLLSPTLPAVAARQATIRVVIDDTKPTNSLVVIPSESKSHQGADRHVGLENHGAQPCLAPAAGGSTADEIPWDVPCGPFLPSQIRRRQPEVWRYRHVAAAARAAREVLKIVELNVAAHLPASALPSERRKRLSMSSLASLSLQAEPRSCADPSRAPPHLPAVPTPPCR